MTFQPGFRGGGLEGSLRYFRMIDLISATPGLQVCLDPADIKSYDASAQYIRDTSGNDQDFGYFRTLPKGDPTADGRTPVSGTLNFNGTPGGLSDQEYLVGDPSVGSFSGRFVGNFNSAPLYDFQQNFHCAGAQWTVAGVFYTPPTNSTWSLFQTSQYNNTYMGKGMTFCRIADNGRLYNTGDRPNRPAGTLHAQAWRNDSNDGAGSVNSGLSVTPNQWVFCAISLDGVAGVARFRVNGSVSTVNVSWGGGSAEKRRCDMNTGTDRGPESTRRMGPVAIWTRALSADELTGLFNQVKKRFVSIA